MSFRAFRWQPHGVRLLLDDGANEVPFSQIAELHMPREDAWDAYCEQLAFLSPECQVAALQMRERASIESPRSNACRPATTARTPIIGIMACGPAWSLEPLWLRHRSIRGRAFVQPHELPLSTWEPAEVQQRYVLAGAWHWQRDRNVQGGPLRAGDADYGWGLGVHAMRSVVPAASGGAARFKAKVGLDELAGDGGCARAIVYLNGTEQSASFRSPLLIGSEQVVDIGTIELHTGDSQSSKGSRLTLLADAAYRDRPMGADPLDIRDLVDWLEPLIELDANLLREDVARRIGDLVPAWQGWQVGEADAGPAMLVNAWDETDRRQPEVSDLGASGRSCSR